MNVNSISQIKINPKIPKISPGDTVKVSFKVKEAGRERVQTLLGLVVRVRRGAGGGNFTVRRVTYGIGVEHTFPFASLRFWRRLRWCDMAKFAVPNFITYVDSVPEKHVSKRDGRRWWKKLLL